MGTDRVLNPQLHFSFIVVMLDRVLIQNPNFCFAIAKVRTMDAESEKRSILPRNEMLILEPSSQIL